MNRIKISSVNFIKHYINNIRNIFFITIFIINFVNSYYYKSININNRTNLIINQDGIFAYNKKFFKKIKNIFLKRKIKHYILKENMNILLMLNLITLNIKL